MRCSKRGQRPTASSTAQTGATARPWSFSPGCCDAVVAHRLVVLGIGDLGVRLEVDGRRRVVLDRDARMQTAGGGAVALLAALAWLVRRHRQLEHGARAGVRLHVAAPLLDRLGQGDEVIGVVVDGRLLGWGGTQEP
jgi:hypothetical protein